MAVKNFVFRENWVGSEMTDMKITFFAIFDPIWTQILTQIGNSFKKNLISIP